MIRGGGRPYGAQKRHAIYFSSKASFDSKWNLAADDDESIWEYSAPVVPKERSPSTDTCSSTASSAAQEIATRYRARIPLAELRTSVSPSSEEYEESDASWTTALDNTLYPPEQSPPVPKTDNLIALCCPSHGEELSGSLREAVEIMEKNGRTDNDQLVCHRPGCRDVVRNLKALTYHLHVHNIHDETLMIMCHLSRKKFDYSFQLVLHCCRYEAGRIRSSPSSPLKQVFFRVLSRFTCLD
ncbi:hypothetical protein C0991_002595 [Blastosporella zonata]|nr:hypothetical protein C0991_002595 [Blastosporella zonata]